MAPGAELQQVFAGFRELLDAFVVLVPHPDVAFESDSIAVGSFEFAVAGAFFANGSGVFVAGRELLDAVVAGVGDPEVTVGCSGVGDRGRFFHLACAGARGSEFCEQFGLGAELLDPVVGPLDDEQVLPPPVTRSRSVRRFGLHAAPVPAWQTLPEEAVQWFLSAWVPFASTLVLLTLAPITAMNLPSGSKRATRLFPVSATSKLPRYRPRSPMVI